MKRGEESGSGMASVKEIMAALPHFDYLIVNDDLADAEQRSIPSSCREPPRSGRKRGRGFSGEVLPTMKRVLLGVTGSISAYKAADIVRLLKKEGSMFRSSRPRTA